MGSNFADVATEYAKNKDLKKQDVEALIAWANGQPHLPEIIELQAILFLHSCYYRIEEAKAAMDTHFTMRSLSPDLFKGQPSQNTIDGSFGNVLPKKTPEGHTIIFGKLLQTSQDHFNVVDHVRYFVMGTMLHLYQEGTSEGHIFVFDMQGVAIGHLTKAMVAGPSFVKKFINHSQEAMPLRLKGVHFFNIVPFMDHLMAFVKPYLKQEAFDLVHLHDSVDDLIQFVPLECLPQDYRGGVEPISVLHEGAKRRYSENSEFFKWDEGQVIDESKQERKLESFENCGKTGNSFRNLDID